MGAWGIKAFESDNGLDVMDVLSNGYVPSHTELMLGEMNSILKNKGFFVPLLMKLIISTIIPR